MKAKDAKSDPMEEKCLFCKFAKKELETAGVFENEKVFAFLDNRPAGLLAGHTLVLPKQHFESIDAISDDYLYETVKAIKRLAAAIKQATNADGMNILQNNGKAAGQLIPHVHFHLIPRKFGDNILFEENRRAPKLMELTETAKAIKEALK